VVDDEGEGHAVHADGSRVAKDESWDLTERPESLDD
jgi:hypothetical protein